METEDQDHTKFTNYSNLVEGNCEYLTFIKNVAAQRTRIHRDSIATLDSYMQDRDRRQNKARLHFEGLVQLIIEVAYFLYSCRTLGKRPEIELDDIRVEEINVRSEEKNFVVVVFYRISDEAIEDRFGAEVFKSIMQHIEQALHSYIQNHKNNEENVPNSAEREYEAAFETFWKQFQQIIGDEQLVQDEISFFLYLQQTNIFYEYSLLYRIRTCSLMDYIRMDSQRFAVYKQFKDVQENLFNNYQQEKKRLKGDLQVLRAKQKQLDNNLVGFFQKIRKEEIKPFLNDKKGSSANIKFHFKLIEKQKDCFEKVIAELSRESTMGLQHNNNLFRPSAQLQYSVELSPEKNYICVKLFLPKIAVNVQNSNFLMFQSNVLTFDAANVQIQLFQPEEQTEQELPKKIVTFKGTSTYSSANSNQSLLQKVLLLMDITMIASRIYEPEMSPKKYVKGGKQSYSKLNNMTKKVSQYTKLFIKCAKAVYND